MWQLPIVRDLVKRAQDRVGGPNSLGWGYLSRQMQEALIAQEVLSVVIGSARDNGVPAASVLCLHMDMQVCAGLIQYDEDDGVPTG